MAKQILIVEDDKLLNQLLVSQLQQSGYEVKGVTSWEEAKGFLKEQEPDLLCWIIDYQTQQVASLLLIWHLLLL